MGGWRFFDNGPYMTAKGSYCSVPEAYAKFCEQKYKEFEKNEDNWGKDCYLTGQELAVAIFEMMEKDDAS